MHGFKSFAEPVSLRLEPDFTAVVGSNGTGKSNLADAVRWALSSGRGSDLRTDRKEEVLFSGSSGRRAANFCEVRLILDNSDGRLPVEAAEVQVARRLYRGGTTEYRLQGVPCRARDIERLLADLGLAEGYAWIGQGRIDDIVNQDPAQRRRLLEDAAGAGLYRERRREAITELARADRELEVERARLQEVRERLPALREAAARNAEAARLRAEIQGLEIGLGRREIARLESALAHTRERQQQAAQAETWSAAALDRQDASAGELARRSRALEEALIRLEGHAGAVETGLQQTIGEAARSQERLRAASERQSQAQQTLQEAEGRRGENERQLAQLLVRRAEIGERTRRAGADQEAALRALARRPQLERALAQTEQELALAQRALEQAAQERERADRAAEEAATAERQAEEALVQAREELGAVQAQEASARAAFEQAASRAANLAEARREADRQRPRAVRAVLQQARDGLSGILGTLGELVQPRDPGHQTAIATALGGQVSDIVCEDEAAARRAIAWLRRERLGRATFLPLGALRPAPAAQAPRVAGCLGAAIALVRYPPQIADAALLRLGRTLVAQDLDAAQAVSQAVGRRLRVVTLDGQTVQVGGPLTGGSAIAFSAGPSSAQLDAAAQQTARAKAVLEQATAALGAQRNGERAAVAEAEKRRAEAGELQARALRCARDLAQAERIAEAGGAARDELGRQLHEIEQLLERPQDGDLQQAAVRQALVEEELQRRQQLAQSLAAQQRDGEEALWRETDALEQAQRQAERAAAEHERLVAWRQLLRRQVAVRQAALRALQALERQAQRQLRELAARRARAQEAALQHDEERLRLVDELARARSTLRENHGEAALQQAAGELPERAERRLLRARRRLQEVGGGSPGAEEQMIEQSRRETEIAERVLDIESAKATLVEVLAQADREVNARYKHACNTVGEAFSQVVGALFGGGSGRLAPVADGVEIEVQLPGKERVRMSWLSGGERALVAISFLFALGSLRPVPFYLLDEVEASLDERNVERFAAFLRRREGQQLVVVTHQRPTMEAAEYLVGTTMQEQGVTHLATVQLGGDARDLGALAGGSGEDAAGDRRSPA